MQTKYCKSVFLTCIAGIYLAAFASVYHQIPGLYGDDGILPVRNFAQFDRRGEAGLEVTRREKPSLVWEASRLGLDFSSMLEFLALCGMVLAALAALFNVFRNVFTFLALWLLYFSIFQVGQVFFQFQWDTLLLEVGALCLLVAPLFPTRKMSNSPSDSVTLWLVKWLFFRFMFASGVVKLTSLCPAWWGLTALDHHFESQCLPTQLAWFAHQLPHWILRLGVISTYVIEIGVPFLFLVPIASLRLFGFWMQVIFQISLIATGNYNFFNLLAIALCVPLLNDEQLTKVIKGKELYARSAESRIGSLIRFLVTAFVYGVMIYWTIRLFNLDINADYTISSKIMFNNRTFANFLSQAVRYSVVLGAISFTLAFIRALVNSLRIDGFFGKTIAMGTTLFYTTIAMGVFAISVVPHCQVDLEVYRMVPPVFHKWHRDTNSLHISNPYGLFRRMTGIGGRPEIILEGSNSLKSGWKEYNFLHKPGNVSVSSKFLLPHQPRVDWQCWFAALDNYQNNPWLMSFIYRLLTNEEEVLDLIDRTQLPFATAPKYIRVQLYTYKYTVAGSGSEDYWQRTLKQEYMQPVTKESITEYLKTLDVDVQKRKPLQSTNKLLKEVLQQVREYARKLKGSVFVMATMMTTIGLKSFI